MNISAPSKHTRANSDTDFLALVALYAAMQGLYEKPAKSYDALVLATATSASTNADMKLEDTFVLALEHIKTVWW